MRRNYLSGVAMSFAVGVGAMNVGCLDLALIGVSTIIRHEQNQERIRQERAIDAERARRDEALNREVKELNTRLERYEGSGYESRQAAPTFVPDNGNLRSQIVIPNKEGLMSDYEGSGESIKKDGKRKRPPYDENGRRIYDENELGRVLFSE